MASTVPQTQDNERPGKRMVAVEHLSPALVELLDNRAGAIIAGSGHGQLTIDIAERKVKRFQALESFLMSATSL